MAFVLKISLNGDVRRNRFENASQLTMAQIKSFVLDSFGLVSFTATYKDDEDDLCTLTEATLPDALEIAAQDKHLLRLEIVPKADVGHDATSPEEYDGPNTGTPPTSDADIYPDALGEAGKVETDEKNHEQGSTDRVMKACAGGCGFAVTFHPSHCCEKCARGKCGNHGPKCAQQRMPETSLEDSDAAPEQPDVKPAPQKPAATEAPAAPADLRELRPAAEDETDEKKDEQVGTDRVMKACAGGCGFAVTFHPTHCCGKCAKGKRGNHGPKCAQQRMPEANLEDSGVAAAEKPAELKEKAEKLNQCLRKLEKERRQAEKHARQEQCEQDKKERKDKKANMMVEKATKTKAQAPETKETESVEKEQVGTDRMMKTCAGGCGFAVTFHPTHCCGKCAKAKGKHGSKCAQQRGMPQSGSEHKDAQPQQPSVEAILQKPAAAADLERALATSARDVQDNSEKHREQGSTDRVMKACAGGCGCAVTFHPTHCCEKCARGKCGNHGPKCAQQQMPETSLEDNDAAPEEPEVDGKKTCMAEGKTASPAIEPEVNGKKDKVAEAKPPEEDQILFRACAAPGCKFQATWHETHCCNACVAGNGHGGRCERKELPLP